MKYFIIYLITEVMISYIVFKYTGIIGALVEILVTMGLGAYILYSMKDILLENFKELIFGEIQIEHLTVRSIFALLGGIFLIVPGVLTDFLGILMQMGFVADYIADRIKEVS
jgi:UPF0716 family protein affecting phage T7 exclusion